MQFLWGRVDLEGICEKTFIADEECMPLMPRENKLDSFTPDKVCYLRPRCGAGSDASDSASIPRLRAKPCLHIKFHS